MKELEKTKRISIAAILAILAIVIAVLSFKKPKHLYAINTKDTLEKITTYDYFISLDKINNPDYVLVDLRNQHEFDKGHLKGAIHVYAPEILSEINSDILKDLKENSKKIILYATNPNEAISSYMLLYQLGYDDIKILCVENSYHQNKLITKMLV